MYPPAAAPKISEESPHSMLNGMRHDMRYGIECVRILPRHAWVTPLGEL